MANSVHENMKRYTQRVLDAYAAWDLDAILADRAEECIYYARPESAGLPQKNNSEYRQWYTAEIMPLMKGGITVWPPTCLSRAELTGYACQLEVSNVVYDTEARKSVLHGISVAESVVGPYRNEMVLITTFNETGDKAVKIEEFFDSAYFQQFGQRLQEAMAQQKQ